MKSLSSLCFVVCCAALSLALSVTEKRQTICNGHAELCDRSYGNVTFVGAHDSYAISRDPIIGITSLGGAVSSVTNTRTVSRNQEVDIPTQLAMGVRMLQAQAHLENGVIHFCHTSCLLFDGGTVESYLTEVATFLTNNPTEVVTLLFTNPESLSLQDVWAPVFESTGIADMAFVPSSLPVAQNEWPTLGEMIKSGKRVVAFLDSGAETGGVDFILPEFEMIWEPPFDSTDPTFPCSVNRTEGPLPNDEHMYLLNHFLDINVFDTGILISDPGAAPTTNGVPSIMADAAGCAPLGGGRFPNFILLDYVNLGNAFEAADMMNGFA